MVVFSSERRDLIGRMKTALKAKSFKGGGLTHKHFVLYAALRGQDVSKTSHQKAGENAFACLQEMVDATHTCFMRQPVFCSLKTPEGKPLLVMKDFEILRLSLIHALSQQHQAQ